MVHGTSLISAPSLSVRVSKQSKPPSRGKGPMKSMATESPRLSGTGSGCKGPIGLVVEDLFCWHSTAHAGRNISIKWLQGLGAYGASSRNDTGFHSFYRNQNGQGCHGPAKKESLKGCLPSGLQDGYPGTKGRLLISGFSCHVRLR
jgi:hypothetical protein